MTLRYIVDVLTLFHSQQHYDWCLNDTHPTHFRCKDHSLLVLMKSLQNYSTTLGAISNSETTKKKLKNKKTWWLTHKQAWKTHVYSMKMETRQNITLYNFTWQYTFWVPQNFFFSVHVCVWPQKCCEHYFWGYR